MSGEIKFEENIELLVKDVHTGEVIDYEKISNTIVDNGLDRVANLINGGSSATYDYIAIGTGTTSPTTSDTALETEVTRALATLTNPTNQAKFEKTFTFSSGESYAITEAGVFDQATVSGSTMLNRSTFTAKNVDVDTSLNVQITITVARG